MKATTVKAFALLAALVLASCQGALQPLTKTSAAGQEGTLTVHANAGHAQRTILPALPPATYTLAVYDTADLGVAVATAVDAAGDFTIHGLNTNRTYLLHVEADDGSTIVAKTDDADPANTVQLLAPAQSTNTFVLQLNFLTKATDPSGVVDFTLNWVEPAGTNIAAVNLDAFLAGTSTPAFATVPLAPSGTSVNHAHTMAPGTYTLVFTLKDAGLLTVATVRYTVLVAGGLTTLTTKTLTRSDFGVPQPVVDQTSQFTNATSNQVVLSWFLPLVNTADALVVMKSTDGGGTFTHYADLPATAVSYTDPAALVPNTHYQYRINAHNGFSPLNGSLNPALIDFQTFDLWGASASLPSVTISGTTSATSSNPVATFTAATNLAPLSSQWLIDAKLVQSNASATILPLIYDTTNLSAGLHQVQVAVTVSGGAVYTSAAWGLTVRDLHTTKVVHSTWQWVQQGYMVAYIRPDGTLWANGLNNHGQLGDGTIINRSVPTYIASDVIDVAVSEIWAAFVKTDGSLWVTGLNTSGQFGDGSLTTAEFHSPHAVSNMASGVVRVSAEGNTLFVLKADGTLWGSGYNTDKNLGIPDDTTDRLTFVQVAQAAGTIGRLYTASEEAFAINTLGELWVAGHNNWGSLGLGTITTPNGWTKVSLPFATPIAEITGGRNQAAIRTTDGKVWVAGNNNGGQLGLTYQNSGTSDAFKTFTFIPGLTDAISVAIGQGPGVGFNQSFISIAKSDGTVVAAGLNGSGAFGDGTVIPNPYYRIGLGLVTGMSQVAQVFGGVDVTTFLKSDGSLWAAGGNDYNVGNNGTGSTFRESFPAKVNFGTAPLKISASAYHNFVIKPDGSLWASGSDTNGQLGDNGSTAQAVFVNVMPGSTFASVAPAWDHTLFLKTDGSVWVVGDNSDGQLGNGTTTPITTPYQIMAPGSAKAVAAAYHFSVILKTDGTVYTAGRNVAGQLGLGDLASTHTTFTMVPGVTGVVAIAVGGDFTLLLRADGTLWTAGVSSANNYGQHGGGAANKSTFTSVLSGVIQISAGDYFSAAVMSDGSLWVAGDGSKGQLGLGNSSNATGGFVKSISSGVASVATGGWHTLVLLKNQSLWAMGNANQVGRTVDQTSPVLLDSNVSAIAAGENYTFFQKTDGTLWWVGDDTNGNANGILGSQGPMSTPQRVW